MRNSSIPEKLAEHICNIMCNLSIQSLAMSYVYALLFWHMLWRHIQTELRGEKREPVHGFTMGECHDHFRLLRQDQHPPSRSHIQGDHQQSVLVKQQARELIHQFSMPAEVRRLLKL